MTPQEIWERACRRVHQAWTYDLSKAPDDLKSALDAADDKASKAMDAVDERMWRWEQEREASKLNDALWVQQQRLKVHEPAPLWAKATFLLMIAAVVAVVMLEWVLG